MKKSDFFDSYFAKIRRNPTVNEGFGPHWVGPMFKPVTDIHCLAGEDKSTRAEERDKSAVKDSAKPPAYRKGMFIFNYPLFSAIPEVEIPEIYVKDKGIVLE